MKLLSNLASAVTLLCGCFNIATCQNVEDNIVTVAVNNGFNTLATAVTAAGLVETLQGEGPFSKFDKMVTTIHVYFQ